MVVAPPRADYDYSPLDLAPPGQRRRRQLVAAGLGGLVMLLLVAAAVFAFLVLRDDDPDDDADIVAMQTQVATLEADVVGTPDVAANTDEAPAGDVAVTPDTGENAAGTEPTAGVDAAGEQAAVEPTTAPDPNVAAGGGFSQEELLALLPTQEIMPTGLDAVTDTTRTQEEVVTALGGNREAETNLATWGWTGNVERSFTASNPAALAPDATTDITVSLHGFSSDAAAAEALTYYSDILVAGGYEEIEVGDIGAANRMLVQPQQDGGTTVALYVQQGPVLYRIGGYSPGGDPTTNVINVAQAMLAP